MLSELQETLKQLTASGSKCVPPHAAQRMVRQLIPTPRAPRAPRALHVDSEVSLELVQGLGKQIEALQLRQSQRDEEIQQRAFTPPCRAPLLRAPTRSRLPPLGAQCVRATMR